MGLTDHQKSNQEGQWNKAKTALYRSIKAAGVTGFAVSTAAMAQDPIPPYEDKGRLGDRQSWQTPEFKANWGLGSSNFDAAYAKGATGQGVKIGVLDSGTYTQHFEFSKPGTVSKFSAPFADGDVPDFDTTEKRLDDHGTHVAGIIAANRNGVGMHGGAFDSTLYVGRVFHDELSKAGAAKAIADTGVIALSNSWGYDFKKSVYRKTMQIIDYDGKKQKGGYGPDINDVLSKNISFKKEFADPNSEFSQLFELAQRGTTVVFAAGNDRYYVASYDYNKNNFRPRLFRSIHTTFGSNMLPTVVADDKARFDSIEKNFLNVVMLNRDTSISHYSDICGVSKYYCVGAAGGSSEGPLNSYTVPTPVVPAGVTIETYKPGPGSLYLYSDVQNGAIQSDYYRTFSTGVTSKAPPAADEATIRQQAAANYVMMYGTSMAAPTASAGLAVIKSRFPYLTNSQVRDTLLSTAKDVGAPGIDRVYGWGSLDLEKAMGGPAKFWRLKASYDTTLTDIEKRAAAQYNPIVAKADYYADLAYQNYQKAKTLRDNYLSTTEADAKESDAYRYAKHAFSIEVSRDQPNEAADTQEAAFEYYDFMVNLPGVRVKDLCDRDECIADTWSNDIDGPGGLSKFGAGALTLTGHNTYRGPTTIYEGVLTVNGSLASDVVVETNGILAGSGTVGSLAVNSGGVVAPGNSIGTLHAGDVNFNAGSRYAVEVAMGGRSDLIDSSGVATLNGGEVMVSLENSANLLTLDEAKPLIGQTFNILTAKKGIVGQFSVFTPNYLFLDSQIGSPPTQQMLEVAPPPTPLPVAVVTPVEPAQPEPEVAVLPTVTPPPVAVVTPVEPAQPVPEVAALPTVTPPAVAVVTPVEPAQPEPEVVVLPMVTPPAVAVVTPVEPAQPLPEVAALPTVTPPAVAVVTPVEPAQPEPEVVALPTVTPPAVAVVTPVEPAQPDPEVAVFPTPNPTPLTVAAVPPEQPTHAMPEVTTLSLGIKRNQTSFASVALTRNERAVAIAADTLTPGSPVYESLLTSYSAEQARQAFKQLDGQVHSDIAAAQLLDSRYLRDAVNARLQQAQTLKTDAQIQVDETNGGWVQLIGGHGQVDTDHNATSYSTSTTGVLLGLDTDVGDGWRAGMATGYTKTDLNGTSRSSADSDNYHLSVYGGKRFDSIALRLGGGTTWHHFDTSRGVVYGNQSAHEKATYGARSDQVFSEVSYTGWSAFEPFANLTYINLQTDSFKERGKAAALHASKQSQDATVSTLGLRGHMQLPVSATQFVNLRGELGWEHQYGELDRETSLKFAGSETAFAVNSVPVSRDGAVVKATAEMAMTKDTLVSLNYTGLVSSHGGGSAVNLGFTFQF